MAEELKACRYRVEKTGYGFWPYCVRAGDGTRELFKGHQKQCMVVAAELETAFEDGKFVADRANACQGGEAVEVVGWRRLDRPYELTAYPSVYAMWHGVGYPVQELYTHPADQVADVRLDGLVLANLQMGRVYLHFKTTEQQHVALRELRALLASQEGVKK